MRKAVIWGFLILVGLLVGWWAYQPDEQLYLIACDVGQGEAILMIHGENQVLVDGGPGDRVLACLGQHLPFWDRKIELVVLTHPQADHYTGLIGVLERYEAGLLVANNVVNDTAGFWALREAVIEEGVEVYAPVRGDEIRVGELSFQVLWPEERTGSVLAWQDSEDNDDREAAILGAATYGGDLNDLSVVLHLKFCGQAGKGCEGEEGFDVLLTGDIGFDQEEQLVEWGLPEVEVLKVAHHGSKYSSSSEFVQAVRAEAAVISVGANNRFGHPTEEVLSLLEREGMRVYRTDKMGEVELVSDGTRLWKR